MKAKVILGALGIVITSAIAVATAFLTVPRGYDTCEVSRLQTPSAVHRGLGEQRQLGHSLWL